jgi:hypothetical protein
MSSQAFALSLSGTMTWSGLPPQSPRTLPTAIYDPTSSRVIVFGGDTNDVLALSLGDTPAWGALAASGTPPPARRGASAIYDEANQQLIVFGGFVSNGTNTTYFNDAWALSLGGSPAWRQLSPLGAPPAAREGHVAIYDAAARRMILYSGSTFGSPPVDVWSLTLSGCQ